MKDLIERVADLERDSHEPQAIRPRVLAVLVEFGFITLPGLPPDDREAVERFMETGES